jgi:NADP-dependent 3-hydroxy acid dehydrogenase YdfG
VAILDPVASVGSTVAGGRNEGVGMAGVLDGTVALVTGSSSGIGAATAERLAAEGAAVALVARRLERLDELADRIGRGGGVAYAIEADVTDQPQAVDAVRRAVDRFGRLDTLVNNAGVMLLGPALQTTTDEWDRMVRLNVEGLLHVTHAALPHLVEAAGGAPRRVADLVNVSSTAGRVARAGSSVYNFTKFGLNGFTESLRQEMIGHRVRVSVVEPGTVDTELVDHVTGDVQQAARNQVAAIEPLLPEDIADSIAYIVTRDRRVAVNEMLVRAGDQTW